MFCSGRPHIKSAKQLIAFSMFKLNTFFYHNQKKRGFSAALPASFLRTCRRLPAHGFRNMQSINIQSAVSLKAGTVGTANGKKQTAKINNLLKREIPTVIEKIESVYQQSVNPK